MATQGANEGPTLTIREASRATGLSVKALRRRIERGTLRAIVVNERRRIPMSELLRAGLLRTEGGDPGGVPVRPGPGMPHTTPSYTPSGYPATFIADLLDRLERQAEEIGRLESALEAAALKPHSTVPLREALEAAQRRIAQLERGLTDHG